MHVFAVLCCLIPAFMGCGGSGGESHSSEPPKAAVILTLDPQNVDLTTGDSRIFVANVKVEGVGTNLYSDPRFGISWSSTGGALSNVPGQDIAWRTFTAPGMVGTFSVTLQSTYDSTKSLTTQVRVYAPPEINSFSVDSPTLWLGDRTTLRWETHNATSLTLLPGGQALPATGTLEIAPLTGVTYTLAAATPARQVTKDLLIDVRVAGTWLLNTSTVLPGISRDGLLPLGDGRVLLLQSSPGAAILDPHTGSVQPTENYPGGRWGPLGLILPDQRVLIFWKNDNKPFFYDPLKDRYTAGSAIIPTVGDNYLLPGSKVLLRTTDGWGTYDTLKDVFALLPAQTFFDYGKGVPLADGRILFRGSFTSGNLAFAAFDPATSTWSPLAIQGLPQVQPVSASLWVGLGDGRILLGGIGPYTSGRQAFLLDPAKGTAVQTGDLTQARPGNPLGILLQDGRVLVAGGNLNYGGGTAACEIFDPATGVFTRTGDLDQAIDTQELPPTLLLGDGRVLIAQSTRLCAFTPGLKPPAPVPLGRFEATAAMNVSRWDCTLTKLPDGKVLATGGLTGQNYFSGTKAAELYDPATGIWRRLPDLLAARGIHASALLPDGRVLLVGGGGGYNSADPFAEIYDPASGTSVAQGFQDFGTATQGGYLLPDGRFVFLRANLEVGWHVLLFDPRYDSFTNLDPYTSSNHFLGADARLPNGDVLVFGYHHDFVGGGTGPDIERFVASTLSWKRLSTSSLVWLDRWALNLGDGRILALPSGNLLDPESGLVVQTAATHDRTLVSNPAILSDGRVLVVSRKPTDPGQSCSVSGTLVFDRAGEAGLGAWTVGPDIPMGICQPRLLPLLDGTVLLQTPQGCWRYRP